MANELQETLNVSFSKSGYSATFGAASATAITISGTAAQKRIQTIGTSAEAVDPGDAGTSGPMYIQNRASVVMTLYVNDGGSDVLVSPIPAGQRVKIYRGSVTYKLAVASGSGDAELLILPA